MIVGFVDVVLDQWSEAEIFSEVFEQLRAVIALVGGESLQLARRHAGVLLADVSVTLFSGGCAVQIKDYLRFRINESCSFEILYVVLCLVTVRADRRRAFEVSRINRSNRASVVQLC